MSLIYEERSSDSPYVEKIMHGWTSSNGSTIRPAECNWHMVFARDASRGRVHPLVVGPLTTAGIASWGEGIEILWIKFRLGTFMPYLPVKDFLDVETNLPCAASQSFWLKGSAWQFPNYENADTFVNRLVCSGLLVSDLVVNAALQDQLPEMPSRTVRHRFLRATGLTRNYIRQMKRAQRAESLLRQGVAILDTVHEVGYFDQPHLTRSLRQFIGYTPAQLVQMNKPQSE